MHVLNLDNWEDYLTHNYCENMIPTVKGWLKDLENLKKGSLKVMAGEASWPCMDVIECFLLQAYPYSDIKEISWIVGPIISVNNNGGNALMRLAKKGRIILYIDKVRALQHFRIMEPENGNPYVFCEEYHEPLEGRKGEEIKSPRRVSSFLNEFDVVVNKLNLKKYTSDNPEGLIKMTIGEIKKLKRILEENEISINVLDSKTIEKIIEVFNIKEQLGL